MALSRYEIRAGYNTIYKEQEVSPVYMISELIDNSKSTYEEIILENNYISKDLPIEIIVDQMNRCLIVKDYGRGFDIFKSVRQKGSDSPKINSTNQYYMGLKDAMSFFSSHCIVISERKNEDGKTVRYANQWIRNEGCLSEDVILQPSGQTGSEIIMFEDYKSAKQYWKNLKFYNFDNSEDFPDEKITDNKKVTRIYRILQSPSDWLSFIMNYLTIRYRPLVNKYNDVFIQSYTISKTGSKDAFVLPNSSDSVTAIYDNISRIKELSLIDKLSFDFSSFFDSSNNLKKFLNRYSEDDKAMRTIERVLYEDLWAYFKKVKNDNESKSRGINYASMPHHFSWKSDLFFREDLYNLSSDLEWDLFPMARDIAKVFLTMMKNQEGKFNFIDFSIDNLIISDSRIITTDKNDNTKFLLDIKASIRSENFSSYGISKHINSSFCGFEIIQNNRCIYHSCLTKKYENFSGDNSSHKQPEFFMSKKFYKTDGKHLPFIEYSRSKRNNQNRLTIPLVGGNVASSSRLLIGSINLPNDINFMSKSNKLEFENKEVLEQFLDETITKSGLAVFCNWIHQFQNTFQDNPKKKKNNIANFFEEQLKAFEEEMNEEELPLSTEINDKIVSVIVENKEVEEIPRLLSAGQEEVVKYLEKTLRKEKNNSFQENKITSIKLENEKDIEINTNIKAMSIWGNKILISMDVESEEGSELKLIETLNENIKIIYPLSNKNTSIEEKEKTVKIIVKRIHTILNNIKGYYEVRKFTNKRLKEDEVINEMKEYISYKFRTIKNDVNKELNRQNDVNTSESNE